MQQQQQQHCQQIPIILILPCIDRLLGWAAVSHPDQQWEMTLSDPEFAPADHLHLLGRAAVGHSNQ